MPRMWSVVQIVMLASLMVNGREASWSGHLSFTSRVWHFTSYMNTTKRLPQDPCQMRECLFLLETDGTICRERPSQRMDTRFWLTRRICMKPENSVFTSPEHHSLAICRTIQPISGANLDAFVSHPISKRFTQTSWKARHISPVNAPIERMKSVSERTDSNGWTIQTFLNIHIPVIDRLVNLHEKRRSNFIVLKTPIWSTRGAKSYIGMNEDETLLMKIVSWGWYQE